MCCSVLELFAYLCLFALAVSAPFLWRISRGENKQCTGFHFFTSHFYTTLANDGPSAVESWTAKKGIDIFEKKIIFIPINKDLHWSLCVVVNPGSILSALNQTGKADDPLSCLIFLDSLNMHSKNRVQTNVMKWLNSEWSRLSKKSDVQSPFKKTSLRIFSPTGKIINRPLTSSFLCHYCSMFFFASSLSEQ